MPVNCQVVHNLQLVRGRPFYGYHKDQRLYIKISLWVAGKLHLPMSPMCAGMHVGWVLGHCFIQRTLGSRNADVAVATWFAAHMCGAS
jgi:hypothetical protein